MRHALLIVLGLTGCGDRTEVPQQPVRDTVVRDAGVRVDAATPFIGVITASETVEISSRFTGVIATIKVGVGDTVAANEVVATMDPTQQQDELRAANAAANAASSAIYAARVEVNAMKRKVALEQKSFDGGISSRQDLDNAKDNLHRAEAAVQTAQMSAGTATARAKTAKDLVASAELRAPFAGKVAAKSGVAGGRVDAGASILRIVAGDKRRVKFAVPPDKKVTLETQITADVGSGQQRAQVTAVIKYASPTIDSASGMVIIEAEVQGDSDLSPGLPAWVQPF